MHVCLAVLPVKLPEVVTALIKQIVLVSIHDPHTSYIYLHVD